MIYFLRFSSLVIYTIAISGVICITALFDRSGETMVRLVRLWIRLILTTCRVRVDAEGLENIDPRQPAVFMSNHPSQADIAALVDSLPVSFRFVAKKELTRIPIFGWAIALTGHIIVDRRNRVRSIAGLDRGAEQIRSGTNVIIFPEGTRSESGALQPFKSGGFHLAIGAGAPIIPVSVSGGRQIFPKNSLRIESGRMRVVYGKPIPTAELTLDDREQLKSEVRQAVLSGMDPRLENV